MNSYSSISLKWLPLCVAAFFLCSASSPAYADATLRGLSSHTRDALKTIGAVLAHSTVTVNR